MGTDDAERQVIEEAYGEQLEWGFAIPWMFRALNSPLTHEGMLSAPRGADQREHTTVAELTGYEDDGIAL